VKVLAEMSGNRTFKIGDCLVEPDLDRISRGSETVTVRPQVMDVLVYLASRGGQTVHTDELLEDLWPGKVVTSASVYNCITELRHAFQSCDNGQPYVDTVPKRGYRLVASVTGLDESRAAASQNAAPPFSRRLNFIVISLLAAAVLLFAYQEWWVSDPPTRSIAVLRFENISPDPDNAYFADGMYEEITAQLGMIQSLAVTSRNSAMHYVPGAAPTRQIATELGVDFLLEGSARKDRSSIRITAQLIDARTDEHLWAEVYDRDLSTASLFDIQADIARRVASALRVRVSSVERGRISGRSTESRVAYDLYLRASQLDYGHDRSANTAAVELLKQALAIDPGFAQARATLASAYVDKALMLGYPRLEWAEFAIALARRAIEDDPSLPSGHFTLAAGHGTLGQLTDAVESFEKVLELQPSNGTAIGWLSFIQYQRGRLDEAVDLIRRGLPIDPTNWVLALNMAEVETSLGNYRNAERWVQAVEAKDPTNRICHRTAS